MNDVDSFRSVKDHATLTVTLDYYADVRRVSHMSWIGIENGKSTSTVWHEKSIGCPFRGPR